MSVREKANKIKKERCKTLIAVLENPKTIENVGSVIRNVDALGISKLYVVDGYQLLPSNWKEMRERRNLHRISVSAIKWTFIRLFPDTKSCLEYLKHKRFVSVVTSPHVKGKTNVCLDDANFTQKHLAVWFGNESHGISDEAVSAAEFCVNIPMHGIIESFNLGTSSGIVLYEVTKQRRQYTHSRRKAMFSQ